MQIVHDVIKTRQAIWKRNTSLVLVSKFHSCLATFMKGRKLILVLVCCLCSHFLIPLPSPPPGIPNLNFWSMKEEFRSQIHRDFIMFAKCLNAQPVPIFLPHLITLWSRWKIHFSGETVKNILPSNVFHTQVSWSKALNIRKL